MRTLDTGDTAKLAELTRIKLLATGVLLICFVVMVLAKLLEHSYPAFGIVAAFAEAATIGGIADWFAVVALFKRPLNLPFPHTAIIPNNRERIAGNLGTFINTNFLARAPVEQKLQDVAFSDEIAVWLSDRARTERLARFVVRFVPQILQSVEDRDLMKAAAQRITAEIGKADLTPVFGNVVQTFTENGRHQRLLDDLIQGLHRFLNDPETLNVLRTKIKREMPVLFNVAGGDVAVLNRILKAATELLFEVKDDMDHPMRAEFERFLLSYIERTRRSRGFAKQMEEVKRIVLSRPELEDATDHLWSSFRDYVLSDLQADNSLLVERLADVLVEISAGLRDAPDLCRDIDRGLAHLIAEVVESQREGIAGYVSDQVRGWDMQQLLDLIEINVGRDLQYIRFNGMIVGGLVGVLLYAVERLIS